VASVDHHDLAPGTVIRWVNAERCRATCPERLGTALQVNNSLVWWFEDRMAVSRAVRLSGTLSAASRDGAAHSAFGPLAIDPGGWVVHYLSGQPESWRTVAPFTWGARATGRQACQRFTDTAFLAPYSSPVGFGLRGSATA
jgi:hypothetical protein